jgi:exosortase
MTKMAPPPSMNAALDSPPTPAPDRLARGIAGLALAIFAATFLYNVAPYWEVNPQYAYGWLVPVLAALLFHRRWALRPAPGAASWRPAKVLLCVVALAFLPTWLVVQPSPDWRLVTWALALQLVGALLLLLYFFGGRAWVRHFAFPILFLASAVPWPFYPEWIIVQNLMQAVAATTVEILQWFNIAALQHGNLIEVRTGMLGVDEACSGIRSLQGTLMAALFLGEYYWLRTSRRIWLVIAGVLLALLCNVGRALLIAVVAARDGLEAVGRWHDPAGYTILTLCLVGVAVIAQFCGPAEIPPKPVFRNPVNPLPRGVFTAVALWLLLSVAATEAWYRLHEGDEKLRWSLHWPETRAGFTDQPVPQAARDLLLYDEGRAASWQQPDGSQWSGFFFRWNSGSARSRVVPRSHRPDICLPAAGYTLEEDFGTRVVQSHGINIPFRSFRFRKDNEDVWVFSCVWQDRAKSAWTDNTEKEWTRMAGIDFVLRGERNLSQQVLEMTMVGYDSLAAAEEALRRELAEMVVPVEGA